MPVVFVWTGLSSMNLFMDVWGFVLLWYMNVDGLRLETVRYGDIAR